MDASDILLQLDLLFIPDAQHPNGNPNVPACCVTDQAYVATDHLIPKTRTQTLAALPPAQRAVIAAEDAANMRPRENIEDVFAKHVALFPAANKAARQRLFRAGRNHWNDICDTVSAAAFLVTFPKRLKEAAAGQWYAQALWANLHTCAYGSQVSGQTVVTPPSIDEYLSNIHAGNYV